MSGELQSALVIFCSMHEWLNLYVTQLCLLVMCLYPCRPVIQVLLSLLVSSVCVLGLLYVCKSYNAIHALYVFQVSLSLPGSYAVPLCGWSFLFEMIMTTRMTFMTRKMTFWFLGIMTSTILLSDWQQVFLFFFMYVLYE